MKRSVKRGGVQGTVTGEGPEKEHQPLKAVLSRKALLLVQNARETPVPQSWDKSDS